MIQYLDMNTTTSFSKIVISGREFIVKLRPAKVTTTIRSREGRFFKSKKNFLEICRSNTKYNNILFNLLQI
jgi:hypothetical protein